MDDYGIDGIDLDIEAGAGDNQVYRDSIYEIINTMYNLDSWA